jgi:hypothetical protein
VAALAGYAALGPVTGPLVAGAVRSFNRGERVLGWLYVLAVPLSYFLMASAAERLIHVI